MTLTTDFSQVYINKPSKIWQVEENRVYLHYYSIKILMANEVDINESELLEKHEDVFNQLLFDHTTRKNIFWATDSYADLKDGYGFHDEITIPKITGKNSNVIRPRAIKSKEEKTQRVKDKAEVFTPSWICNAQNNLVDNAWFGRKEVFNHENNPEDGSHSWTTTKGHIEFPEGKSWKDYVSQNVMEITCGEAPYLVSRYDTVSGEAIPIENRIGMLDRKLRIVSENTDNSDDWLTYAEIAFKSTYGYEWQGDNLLLARESLFFTFIDYYKKNYSKLPNDKSLNDIAYIISWNIWQMDGLKGVLPDSCHDVKVPVPKDAFATDGDDGYKMVPCLGCRKHYIFHHNGIYSLIMDWDKGEPIRYVDLLTNS